MLSNLWWCSFVVKHDTACVEIYTRNHHLSFPIVQVGVLGKEVSKFLRVYGAGFLKGFQDDGWPKVEEIFGDRVREDFDQFVCGLLFLTEVMTCQN